MFQVDLRRNVLTVTLSTGNESSGRTGGGRGKRWGSERKATGRSRIQEGGIGWENELDHQGLERRKGWGGLEEEEVEVASQNHSLDKRGLRGDRTVAEGGGPWGCESRESHISVFQGQGRPGVFGGRGSPRRGREGSGGLGQCG